ncbi:20728_t:CDS:1, partial [Dentiscutata erythropus]
ERYNPIPMNPAFPNDRHHMGFSPHPQGPNGAAPTMMPPEFNGSPFPTPYGQYPPFHGFSPVAAAT